MQILFTGVGRRIELIQAFREAALKLNKNLKIYGADLTGTAPALAYCDYSRKTLPMKDAGYIDNLLDICRKDNIDLLIPTIDTDLLVLSENKHRFETIGTKVLVSDEAMIKVCRDKNITSEFFVKCGLKAPMPCNNWEEYKGGFPAFIKPKDGSSSINAFKVENAEELELYANQIEEYVVQPFVSGKEYTIDIFCDYEGRPLSIVPRQRMQVRAGEVLKTCIFMDEKMIKEGEKLCEVFKPCGPITVQLIRDSKEEDWFIEINPRFGGGAPLSMKAGARSAECLLKLAFGDEVEKINRISDGAIYSRFDQSVCITPGVSEIKGVIFDLDDTLYSEKEYVESGYKAVSDYLKADYTSELLGYFKEGKQAIDELLKRVGKEELKDDVLNVYRMHKPDIHLYDGVIDVFATLKKKGIKIGIITDGRTEGQKQKISALGLKVDDVIITDELGGPQFRKPCDISFRIMQRRWRMSFSNMVYVGDNINKDFQAPRQLGMNCIFYKNNDGLYQKDEEVADNVSVVSSVKEILKFVV